MLKWWWIDVCAKIIKYVWERWQWMWNDEDELKRWNIKLYYCVCKNDDGWYDKCVTMYINYIIMMMTCINDHVIINYD